MTPAQLRAQDLLIALETLQAAGEPVPDEMAAEAIHLLVKAGPKARHAATIEAGPVVIDLGHNGRITAKSGHIRDWAPEALRALAATLIGRNLGAGESRVATSRCPCGRVFTWERVGEGRCPACGRPPAETFAVLRS